MENEIRNPESGGISVERTFTIIDSKIGSKRNEEETKGEQTYFVSRGKCTSRVRSDEQRTDYELIVPFLSFIRSFLASFLR